METTFEPKDKEIKDIEELEIVEYKEDEIVNQQEEPMEVENVRSEIDQDDENKDQNTQLRPKFVYHLGGILYDTRENNKNDNRTDQ